MAREETMTIDEALGKRCKDRIETMTMVALILSQTTAGSTAKDMDTGEIVSLDQLAHGAAIGISWAISLLKGDIDGDIRGAVDQIIRVALKYESDHPELRNPTDEYTYLTTGPDGREG